MKSNSMFLVAVMSILLSACGSTSGTDRNTVNDNASGTRHVSEGSGDWTDTPSNATPPVLDGQPSVNSNAAGTRHVSEGAGDWTDTPSDTTPPVLDGQSTVREGVSDCSQDKNYIYGTNQGCDFSIEAFQSGAVQKLKCVDEDVYVNDVLMSNHKVGNLMLVCK